MKTNSKSIVSKLTFNEVSEINGGIPVSIQINGSNDLPIIPFGDPRDWDPFFKNIPHVHY